jgi:hypothetical protein
MRFRILVGIMGAATLFLTACGDDDGSSAVGDVATTTFDEPATPAGDTTAPPDLDLCEFVDRADVESIVARAATNSERISVDDRPRPLRGACAFSIQASGVGGSFVNLMVLDEFSFGRDRDSEDVDVEDVSGLGDEAFTFHDMVGRALHVRSGSTYFTVRVGSYDVQMGLTEDSLRRLAELILAGL